MVILGVSGGVDSSVAALLLKQAGHRVHGVFMHNWEDDDAHCRANEDRADALRVCAALDIPFFVRNFAQIYRDQVFARFLADYAQGLTPNPDILCNREVKFKVFLDEAMSMGAEQVATGHYARRAKVDNAWVLLRGVDPGKDQSYFLQAITQDALARTLFPIGELPKPQVRALAEQAGLVTAAKKDSTGICFIGEQDFKTFLGRYLPAQPGEIVDESGRVVGTHPGALYYTVGQRAPLGGVKGAGPAPWFVLSKDVAGNRLVVGQGRNHPRLMASRATTQVASWIAGFPPSSDFEAQVQIRHLGEAHPARVIVNDDGTLSIAFLEPVRAVAPGQAAGVYQGQVCLGGAQIQQAA